MESVHVVVRARECASLRALDAASQLPGPPRSTNDMLKSKQHMHDGPLQMQFFELDSELCRLCSERDIKSMAFNWTDKRIRA